MRGRRNAGIDTVRVIGMLAIVAGHMFDGTVARALLYSWHVPLFFFLSGVLWKPGRAVLYEVRGRARTLLLPYLCWLAIVGAVAVPVLIHRDLLDGEVVRNIVWAGRDQGAPFWAFYFAPALFFACVWARLLDVLPLPARFAVAATSPHWWSTSPASRSPQRRWDSRSPRSASSASSRVRPSPSSEQAPPVSVPPIAVGLVLLCVGVLAALLLRVPVDVKLLDLGVPALSLAVAFSIAAGLLLTAEYLCARAPTRVAELLTMLAVSTLVVLFVHVPIAWLLHGFAPEGSVPAFAVTAAVSWGLGLLLVRFRWAWPLTAARG